MYNNALFANAKKCFSLTSQFKLQILSLCLPLSSHISLSSFLFLPISLSLLLPLSTHKSFSLSLSSHIFLYPFLFIPLNICFYVLSLLFITVSISSLSRSCFSPVHHFSVLRNYFSSFFLFHSVFCFVTFSFATFFVSVSFRCNLKHL